MMLIESSTPPTVEVDFAPLGSGPGKYWALGSGEGWWQLLFAMSITATVENNTIKLPLGVQVPDGTEVEVLLPGGSGSAEDGTTLYERRKEFIACVNDGPEDLAAGHDLHAHGTPKRSNW